MNSPLHPRRASVTGTKVYSLDTLINAPFLEVLDRVKIALRDHGFGTVSELDIQATLKSKLGRNLPGYTVLGVCDADLAAQAIDAEPAVGVFLPCTILVRDTAAGVVVQAQDPTLVGRIFENPKLDVMTSVARTRLESALDDI